MHWRLARLTALYVGSCFVLIVCTIGPDGAIGILRRGSERLMARVPDVPLDSLPAVSAVSRVSAVPARDQGKKPGPHVHEYHVPAGSVLMVQLRTPISSASSQIDDQVDATLSEAVTQDGVELIPAGSVVHGTLLDVVPASSKGVRGQVTMTFAIVQHAVTKSRAAIRTRRITIEAQPPEQPADSRRASKRQPIELMLPAGHPLQLTLADPLVVFIPAPAPARGQSQGATP
jgi:hypothetical protein